MLRCTRGLNERRVSFRGGRGCSQCCVSSTGGAEGGCPRTRVIGGEEARRQLGAGAQRLGEEAKWTRGHPGELVAGGNGEWGSVRGGLKLGGENGNGDGYGGFSVQME